MWIECQVVERKKKNTRHKSKNELFNIASVLVRTSHMRSRANSGTKISSVYLFTLFFISAHFSFLIINIYIRFIFWGWKQGKYIVRKVWFLFYCYGLPIHSAYHRGPAPAREMREAKWHGIRDDNAEIIILNVARVYIIFFFLFFFGARFCLPIHIFCVEFSCACILF